jgi:hypothetical protein
MNFCGFEKLDGGVCRAKVKAGSKCHHHRDPIFEPTRLAEYIEVLRALKLYTDQLEHDGINVLSIQNCWNNNLAGPRQHEFPPQFAIVGPLFERQTQLYGELCGVAKRANFVLTAIAHQILNPNPDCCYCCRTSQAYTNF